MSILIFLKRCNFGKEENSDEIADSDFATVRNFAAMNIHSLFLIHYSPHTFIFALVSYVSVIVLITTDFREKAYK